MDFSIRSIISSAWKNVKGVKWPIWLALIVLALIGIGVSLVAGLITISMGIPIMHADAVGTTMSFNHILSVFIIVLIFEIIGIFLMTPLSAGAQMVALKKARGEMVSATTGFGYWHKWLRLGLTAIFFSIGALILYFIFGLLSNISAGAGLTWLGSIFSTLGTIAFILYYTFFIFNILFVADKDKGPWSALGYSAKAVAPHWFRVFLLFIYIGILFVVALIPAILGLMCPYTWVRVVSAIASIALIIWIIPYAHMMFSTAYDKLSAALN